MQIFNNDNCDNLIPQGNVLSERDYVRVTLLNITLDDKAINQLMAGNNVQNYFPATYALGLPMSFLDPNLGAQATNAIKVLHNKEEMLLGLDSSFLPGYKSPINKKISTIWLTEKEISKGNIHFNDSKILISKEEKDILRRAGKVRVLHLNKHVLHLRIKKLFQTKQTNLRTNTQALFSQINPTVYTQDNNGFNLFIQYLKNYGNSIEDIINGFLADTRAGDWYDPNLTAWSMWIPGLSDDVFSFYLSKLKNKPQWPQLASPPQLPNYPIALVNIFKQTQELIGYSRGRLVESVTLGPEETVETEIFNWDRSINEKKEEFSTEFESTTEREQNNSTNAQITNEMENNIGANVGGNLGVGIPMESIKLDGGIDGGVSTELQSRNENTIDLLTEGTEKASERFKATHQIKTLTRRETGTETRTTRKFKNPNLGRTLNLHHFEVLGHYKVETKLDDRLRLALLVENDSYGNMDRDWVRAYHYFLNKVLLDDVYKEGLKAAQILAAQEWIDELAAAEKRAEEEERQRLAEIETSSQTNNTTDSPASLPKKGIFDKASKMRDIFEKLLEYKFEDALDVIIRFHVFNTEITTQEIQKADQIVSRVAWWTQFTVAYPIMNEMAEQYINDIKVAENETDPILQKDMVISAVGNIVTNLDDDWLIGLKSFVAGYHLAYLALPEALNPVAYAYIMKLIYSPNDMGLQKLITKIRADYTQHEAKQSVETLAPPSADPATITPADKIPAPPRAYTLKELAEAHASFGRLKIHLEEHEMYYRNEFYKREDSALRMQRLEMMGVAPYVENMLLGFAGTSAIFPLKLESLPTETREKLENLRANTEKNNKSYVRESTITLPTNGITSEVVIGQCNALEPYLTERREQDLKERDLKNQLLEAQILSITEATKPSTEDSDSDV